MARRIFFKGIMTKAKKKQRLDLLLVEKGMSSSIEKAKALIMTGSVLVNDVPLDKAGDLVDADAVLRVKGEEHSFVGRGGLKLQRALEFFSIDVGGKTCLDVGSSTGGFTDCLLQRGAKKVYAVDVAYGIIDMKLRKDERVVLIERMNIRNLEKEKVPEPVDIVVIDVSFISLTKVLPVLKKFLAQSAQIIALVKPQFEVAKEHVGKGGIVRDDTHRIAALTALKEFAEKEGFDWRGVCDSPILGMKGNKEFLILLA